MVKHSKAILFFVALLASPISRAQSSGVITLPITSLANQSIVCNELRDQATRKMWDALSPIAKTTMETSGRWYFGSVGQCSCVFDNPSNALRSAGTCSSKYDGTSHMVERYYYISTRSAATCEFFDTHDREDFKKYIRSAVERQNNFEPKIEQSLCEQLNGETRAVSFRWTPNK